MVQKSNLGRAIRRLGTMGGELLVPTMLPVRDKVLRALGSVRPLSRAELASHRVSDTRWLEALCFLPSISLILPWLNCLASPTSAKTRRLPSLYQVEIDGIPLFITFVKFGLRIFAKSHRRRATPFNCF